MQLSKHTLLGMKRGMEAIEAGDEKMIGHNVNIYNGAGGAGSNWDRIVLLDACTGKVEAMLSTDEWKTYMKFNMSSAILGMTHL